MPTMNRKILFRGGLLIILCVVILFAQRLILGNAKPVNLKSAPALTGQISQALGPKPDGSLPIVQKDYTINPAYFDNGKWAVADIVPISKTSQGGFVVMEKNSGIYQVAIGPGTAMASTQLQGIPQDVAAYLIGRVAIYNPIPGQK